MPRPTGFVVTAPGRPAKSLFEDWVERATSPPQQASGLFHPSQSFQTRSKAASHVPRRARWAGIVLLGLLAGSLHGAEHRGRQFLGWDRVAPETWNRASTIESPQVVVTSPPIVADIEWTEAVLSWNAATPPGTGLKIEVRRLEPAPATRSYVMGLWSSDPAGPPRESVPGQKDEQGEVQTDTLVLAQAARTAQVRVTLIGDGRGGMPELSLLGLSLLDPRYMLDPLPPNRAAWGHELAVPERTQVVYPEGVSAWCSPTSLAMLLAYWGETTRRPDLNLEVPVVAQAVNDPRWPGTGNWSFNVAFAGSLPGMRAYVTRLSDVAELEDWIAAGAPIAVSVSYNLLRGLPRDRSDGHLVVVRGFTANGDVIVNDPGTGKEIRRVFSRSNLARAWAVSQNTVYVVQPVTHVSPPDRFGHWLSR